MLIKIKSKKALTLVEVMIAAMLFASMFGALAAVDYWAKRQVKKQDLNTQLQLEVQPILDHIQKNMFIGIGMLAPNVQVVDQYKRAVLVWPRANSYVIVIRVGNNDPVDVFDINDKFVAYYFDRANHNLYFYNNPTEQEITNLSGGNFVANGSILLSDKITNFTAVRVAVDYSGNNDNGVDDAYFLRRISLTARSNPAEDANNIINPEITLTTEVCPRSMSIS